MRKFMQFCTFLTSLLFASIAMANAPSIGDIANTLITGTTFITHIVVVACVAVGLGFIIMALSIYKTHRDNPKFVPLDRVVMFFVLGLCVICIPFLGKIFAPTGSALDLKDKEAQNFTINIDAPLEIK